METVEELRIKRQRRKGLLQQVSVQEVKKHGKESG